MFSNYFKTAWRNLWKNRFYSIINITGLAAGLAVGILILMWVKDEFSHDRFHNNVDNIYTVVSNIGDKENRQAFAYVPGTIAPFSLQEIPEVRNAVRFSDDFTFSRITSGNKEFTERQTAFVDPSIFSVFDFRLLKGNRKTPFPDNNSVIISETVAKKYFGNEDPIGKVLQADMTYNFTVQGVMKDFPMNSSLRYDMLFPFSILISTYVPNDAWKSLETDWGNYGYATFLEVRPDADTKKIEQKLTQLQRKHNQYDKGSFYTLQPLAKKHLFAPDGSEEGMQTVRVFMLVAILLLLIACINYVNLSTARSIIRSKEISIRKIVGAARIQLFFQFIFETAILFVLSSTLALLMIYMLMPMYNDISGKNLQFQLFDSGIWLIIGIIILSAMVLSSIYPALLLSSFEPIRVLKGKLSFGVGNVTFRKVLVVSQFVFSVGLIIATLIISRQLTFIRERELGYNKDHVLSFPTRNFQDHFETVKNNLLQQKSISGVAGSSQNIINSNIITGDTEWDGKESDRMFMIHPIGVDKDFLSVFKLNILKGSGFTGSRGDSTRFLLNETAVREAGIVDPVGKRFKLWQNEGVIAGVVKDFHFASLKQKIEPAIFYYSRANSLMYVKTTGRDASSAIRAVSGLWNQYNDGFPFEYQFLDETYDRMYKEEQRTGFLFQIFAVLAIIISCLGLLGLATYTAQIKIKEIGIRKVLGASVMNITGMLSKDFIKLVLIGMCIASPIAWYFMKKWLDDFVYRTNISWTIFVFTGMVVIIVAFLTISFQAIKAAMANPVRNLRSE